MAAIGSSSAGPSGEVGGDVPGRECGHLAPLALSQSWLLELVLEKVPETKDRNSCSLVCKDFKDAERQTRKHVRLRCLRKEVKLMPSCFQAVTDLDLSSVFPHFVTKFPYSVTQLKYLGKCFPNVRSLTFFCDGCQVWLKKNRLPFEGIWPVLETVTVLQPGYYQSYPSYKEFSGGRISYGPLKLKPRTGSSDVEHSQQGGIGLKEVHFHLAGQLELEALAEADVADLDTLSFHVQRAAPPPDLSILCSARFSSLEHVSVSVDVFRWRRHVATDDNLKKFLVALPHCTRSLCVDGHSGPEMTTIPLPPELAGSLRILRLRLQSSPWRDNTFVDLSPILECSSLEVLELANPSVLTISTHLDVLVAILQKCRAVKSLKLDLWGAAFSQTPEELCLALNHIALASSETLTEVGISTLSWSRGGDVFTSFSPFRSQVASLSCRIRTTTADQSLEMVGWPLLIHLDLDLVGVPRALSIECPNLQTLKLRMAPTELNLVGEHTKLASAALHFSDMYRSPNTPESCVQIFIELQKLNSLTELSVFNMIRSEAFWDDKRGAEAIAALPFLKKLLISFREESVRVYDISTISENVWEHFKRLLASPSLTELRVHEPVLEKIIESSFEKLYGHRQEVSHSRLHDFASASKCGGIEQLRKCKPQDLAFVEYLGLLPAHPRLIVNKLSADCRCGLAPVGGSAQWGHLP